MSISLALPPVLTNKQGEPRKVGFEIEFTGIPLIDTANIIAELLVGKVEVVHQNRLAVKTLSHGIFNVELDVKLLQRLSQEVRHAQESQLSEQLAIQLKQMTVNMLSPMLSTIAPTEIVTPPLAFSELKLLDQLCQLLRNHCAKGTHASVLYAFGVHINPEVVAFDATSIHNHLLAFVLLYDWLKAKSKIDITRQITQFAKPYPKAYVELLLHKHYGDNLAELIEDYLYLNPTRNRALDMLPLFSYLARDRVKAKVADERIKARPTFHYRLPNCQVDEPNWSILEPWNLWVQVEKLALNPHGLAQRYQQHFNSLKYNFTAEDWVVEVETWLKANP
jgi:hypothetical protein